MIHCKAEPCQVIKLFPRLPPRAWQGIQKQALVYSEKPIKVEPWKLLAAVAELFPSRRRQRVSSVVVGFPQKRQANTGRQSILWNSPSSKNWNLTQMFQTSRTGHSHRLFIARAESHHKKPIWENRIPNFPTSFFYIEVVPWKSDDEDGGGSGGDKVDIVCKVGARLVNVFATALCLPRVINIIVITCHLLLLKADNPFAKKFYRSNLIFWIVAACYVPFWNFCYWASWGQPELEQILECPLSLEQCLEPDKGPRASKTSLAPGSTFESLNNKKGITASEMHIALRIFCSTLWNGWRGNGWRGNGWRGNGWRGNRWRLPHTATDWPKCSCIYRLKCSKATSGWLVGWLSDCTYSKSTCGANNNN